MLFTKVKGLDLVIIDIIIDESSQWIVSLFFAYETAGDLFLFKISNLCLVTSAREPSPCTLKAESIIVHHDSALGAL